MLGLPFKQIWALDFEFVSEPGARPVPVCMVARELGSNRLIRLWQDELGAGPPFPIDDDTLFVAYFASAEMGCFLELGWPVPTRILDLYTEFRNATNGIPLPGGRGLLGALSHHGIPSITADQKTEERALVMRGGPWTAPSDAASSTTARPTWTRSARSWSGCCPAIRARPNGLGQALLRGRYMAAVARMERTGVPIDIDDAGAAAGALGRHQARPGRGRSTRTTASTRARRSRPDCSPAISSTTASTGRGPTTGRLQLDQDTFRDMAKRYPQLEPLKELRHSLSELRLEKLAVGPDGRNRTLLSPFGARSGRNTPSNNKFIFGPSVWLRGLIKPPRGRALAYIDWKSQEVFIAAALSGDPGAAGRGVVGRPVSGVREDGRAGRRPTQPSSRTRRFGTCARRACSAPTTECRPRAWRCGPGYR